MNELIINILTASVTGLTESQKFDALRRFNIGQGLADMRIFIAGVVLIAALLVVLKLYQKSRQWKEEEASQKSFENNVERLALDTEERNLILQIAKNAGLKRLDSVFSMPEAYDKGSAFVMKKSFSSGKSLVERKHLNQKIISLKEKLGFGKNTFSYRASDKSFRHKGHSSRQIPVGRSVLISRIHSNNASPMTAAVYENSHFELKLNTPESIDASPGEVWRVLYQLGQAVWKFDSLVVSSQENEICLSHTDNIRFINRRRFVHSPVDLHGYVARFPCAKTIDDKKIEHLPQFISAKIIEISGPGLLIYAPLKVRTGDRLLVIFGLSDSRTIQSTAEVRRCDSEDEGYKIAVELTNINESCINELITAANNAARNAISKEEFQPAGNKSQKV